MLTNFERSKKVIKKLYPIAERAIKDKEQGVGGYVRRRLRQLSQAYGARLLSKGRGPIDYSLPTTQIAYVYRTMSSHGDWLY